MPGGDEPLAPWRDATGTIWCDVVRSTRARRLSISVTAAGVVATLPQRTRQSAVAPALCARRDWLYRALLSLRGARVAHVAELSTPLLPETFELASTACVLHVGYWHDRTRATLADDGGAPRRVLVVRGDFDERGAASLLQRWLVREARAVVVPRLHELARVLGVTVASTSVRRQRTIWASCSSRGAISLNASIVFLPPALVRFVLLHELCHRLEHNHSARFWRLVVDFDPRAAAHRDALGTASALVPRWARAAAPPAAVAKIPLPPLGGA